MQKETMAVPLVRRWRLPLLVFSGLLTGFCVVFPILGVLQWLSLVPCMLVLYDIGAQEAAGQRQRLRRIWTLGLLFYMCYYPVNSRGYIAKNQWKFTG